MSEIKDRIKKIRDDQHLTQTDFGARIGVRGNTITNYETGLRKPSEDVMMAIARTFDVNMVWLKEGTGQAYIQKTKDMELAEMFADVQLCDDGSFKKRLITALARLDEKGWENLESLLNLINETE